MSKAIYKPKGKAGEYAEWACNLHVGCSNGCTYCYLRRGVLGTAMGQPEATLKRCFRNEQEAADVFEKELRSHLEELRHSGLFFTFSSDPMLPGTRALVWKCVIIAVLNDVPVWLLTKRADFLNDPMLALDTVKAGSAIRRLVAWGFTLTGADELEPGASSNDERIAAMRELHRQGFRTFASLEPVIEPGKTLGMAIEASDCCNLFLVGLQSGRPRSSYNRDAVVRMVQGIRDAGVPVYLKKSLTAFLGEKEDVRPNIFKI